MKQTVFKDLIKNSDILKALDLMEFEFPTEVQEKVIPQILNNKDLIVQSQTGSGKTAAFAIPLCQQLEIEVKNPRVLILTPTRELAVQVHKDITTIGRFKRIRCAAVYGKQPIRIQINDLRQRVHVVVGTPGRVRDLIERGNLVVDDIEYLVIDEADEMLSLGFFEQVEDILKTLPQNRMSSLFSATINDQVKTICNTYLNDPIQIKIQSEEDVMDKIKQMYYEVEEYDELRTLNKLIYLEKPESCILFCNTRARVDEVVEFMKRKDFYCEGIHGGMDQSIRLQTIRRFKRGEFHFLVATDVMGRGIHVDDMTHVINIDLPEEKANYIHRIGRTGRAGKEGRAISFVSSEEMDLLAEIEQLTGETIIKMEMTDVDHQEKDAFFEENIKSKPKAKKDVSEKLNKDITKIRINAGKKKKIRAGDIVGTLMSIEGMTSEDIGIIDVQPTCTYVEIFGRKGEVVLKALNNKTLKGKPFTFKKVRHRSL